MTTPEAAARYLAEHLQSVAGRGYAVFNPHSKPLEELPVIFGFNNGGSRGWLSGVLISQDGQILGGHVCSDEEYMRHDLGILEGSRPDRHETFREHYPDGYRMEFVSYDDVSDHTAIRAAFEARDVKASATVAVAAEGV